MKLKPIFWCVAAMSWASGAFASVPTLRPEIVHTADSRKRDQYVKDGIIVGGDRTLDDVIVMDIRRAKNPSYERIVLDIQANRDGDAAAVSRPPYYQVAMSPDLQRLTVTVWGKPKLAFNSKRVLSSFKKSELIRKVELYPLLEKDRWTFSIELSGKPGGRGVEVFELSNPVRVILDISHAR